MNRLLNNRLAECRAAKGINKSQLAHRLKKSRAYVTRLERGDIKPSIEVALKLARYFDKTVEFMFQLIEEDVKQNNLSSLFTTVPAKPLCHSPATPPARPAGTVSIPDKSPVSPAAKVVAPLSRSKPNGKK